MQRIADGIELEDGEIHADAISYVSDDRNQAGIEIHSGRNRIVRRIFGTSGYRVTSSTASISPVSPRKICRADAGVTSLRRR